MTEENRGLSCREAGRLGGKKTAEKYGSDHYVRIGRMGGKRVRELINRAKERKNDPHLG